MAKTKMEKNNNNNKKSPTTRGHKTLNCLQWQERQSRELETEKRESTLNCPSHRHQKVLGKRKGKDEGKRKDKDVAKRKQEKGKRDGYSRDREDVSKHFELLEFPREMKPIGFCSLLSLSLSPYICRYILVYIYTLVCVYIFSYICILYISFISFIFYIYLLYICKDIFYIYTHSQTSVPKCLGSQTIHFLTKLFKEKKCHSCPTKLDSLPDNPVMLIPI